MKLSSEKIISLLILSLLGSGSGGKTVSGAQNPPVISYPTRINLGNTFKSFDQSQPINKRDIDKSDNAIFAGYSISFEKQKNCTAAFLANKQGVDGFITSAQCCVRNNCNFFPNQSADNVYGNEDDGNVNPIGTVYDIMFGNNGLDYVFVTSKLIDWDNIPYTTGLPSDDGTIVELNPITSYLTLNETGHEVCAYGAKIGYLCGFLEAINVEITVPNPWNGSLTNLSVNEVYLIGEKEFENEDIGGPVYIQIDNNGTTIAQALGHITQTGRRNFYYTPIEKVLSAGNIELTTLQKDNATNITERKNLEWNDTVNIMDSNEQSNYIYAGKRIYVENTATGAGFPCTAGFPVIKPNGIKGILTAGHCVERNNDPNVYTTINNTLEIIGDVEIVAKGDRDGNEYAFIELYTWIYGDPTACTVKADRNGILRFVPINSIYIPKLGERVCSFGSFNGYICGKIIEVNATAEFNLEGGKSFVAKGLHKIDTWNKTGGGGDSGGPVYISQGLVRAQAVGHIVGGGKQGRRNVLYYMPIKKTLDALGGYNIITAESCPD
ncbi:hypothetical protein C2G38_2221443 [Gigaspora rosea]|uniref:Trypsin-like cysteine/serine peptidase domain-containing protein n=1 Tax=Gigaspora rosea TaxID=44941 RepID=A0A397U6R1_9GLOM|nr:hypothetical protein C2G38_2221443 [Gigaspora rosea]